MREELKVIAEKTEESVKIRVQGTCTEELVYSVIASLFEAVRDGGKKDED